LVSLPRPSAQDLRALPVGSVVVPQLPEYETVEYELSCMMDLIARPTPSNSAVVQ
jgi:hypothetical protein